MKIKEIHKLPQKFRVKVEVKKNNLRILIFILRKSKGSGKDLPQMKPYAVLTAQTIPDQEEYFPDPKDEDQMARLIPW